MSNRLTHCSAFCSLAERRANFQKKRLTTRRQSRNITVPPSITPAQLYTKPRRPPWAATFSATMAISGSGGKKDSTIARVTGAMGPRSPKLSSRASQNSSVPSWWSQPIIVISIPRVPSLSFFFSISGFYDTPVNKIRAFLSYHLYYETAGAFPAQGGDLYAFPSASAAAFSARACIRSICWARIRSQRASPASSGIWTQRAKLQCRPSRRASL